MKMVQCKLILLALSLLPALAQAWWNPDWSYRKAITLETGPAGANLALDAHEVPVLIRLHTGNFRYFPDVAEGGRDLRFLSGDDQVALKFHIEKFDAVNEMALIWVKVPKLSAGAGANTIWMYYGNPNAVSAADAPGTYDGDQVLVYHFRGGGEAPHDSTAYGNRAAAWEAGTSENSLIGAGARFDGAQQLRIADHPSLRADPAKGWTLGFWFRVEALPGAPQPLMVRADASAALAMELTPAGLAARVTRAGKIVETPSANLTPGDWHHAGLVLAGDGIELFLDGAPAGSVKTAVPALSGDIRIGRAEPGAPGFVGDIDELEISSVARPQPWLAAVVRSQAPGTAMIVYGEDADQASGGGDEESYFLITLRNVTADGWVVIGLLAVMGAISWVVMISKGIVIRRVRKDNQGFARHFAKLGIGHIQDLDSEESAQEKELEDSPIMLALAGAHDHFQSSTVYRIYHAGVQEMRQRMAKSAGARAARLVLTPQAIAAIRATMDGAMTRENQKLNGQMVLLTIAISGGPFLGLLGTVVGVMITFAAIAASGDVNVNSIAPGIAAALVATVAGLAVAIPALFGYNYLGTRIKEISSDMHVFVDEFVTKIAEEYG